MNTTSLNTEQQKAAEHTEGPLLIVAGAGAGKTKTVTHRIMNLIAHGVAPEQILAVTFTNKAAREMNERLATLLRQARENTAPTPFHSTGQPFIGTFHGLSVYILRNHGDRLGISKYFTILDRDDSLRHIKQAMKTLDIDPKQFEPRKVLNKISHFKSLGLNVTEFAAESSKHAFGNIIANIWRLYDEAIRKHKSLDFDDLLLSVVILFKRHPDVLVYYQTLWQYIHVDEYQDTNGIQYALVQMLAARHKNICVVGDIDQSIYSWRGANFENLMRFEEDYPDATVILLEQNYRSTKTILAAANAIIQKNSKRKEKNLFTENVEGEKITLTTALDEKGEALFVADTCRSLIHAGTDPEKIAILYRANFQSRVMEEALLKAGVPYQVLGVRFFERQEIKDMLAYARFALNRDDLESMKRSINIPPRGIGKVTLAKIAAGEAHTLPAKARAAYQDFVAIIDTINEYILTHSVQDSLKYILGKSGIEDALRGGTEDDKERLENIKELVSLSEKYAHLSGADGMHELISEAALASDQDTLGTGKSGIRLMTIHASKGLEFNTVFVTGLEQGLFPHQGFGDENRDDEEERRLCYVALTRAEEKLYLTYAQTRTIFGSRQVNLPSEFILDLPDELVEAESAPDTAYGDTIEYLDF